MTQTQHRNRGHDNPLREKARVLFSCACVCLVTGAVYGKEECDTPRNQISGYIQVQYIYDFRADADPNNEFQIRRGRIRLNSTITDNILGVAEIDCGRGELTVKDIGIEYDITRSLNLFIGQHKMPFSREQLRSASKLLVIDRGIVNEAFGRCGYLGRDIGLSLMGEIGSDTYPVEYAVGIFNGSGENMIGDIDNTMQFAERIVFCPVGDLSIGINSTQKTDSLTGDLMVAYGGDFLFQKRGIKVEGELLVGNSTTDATMVGATMTGSYRIGCWESAIKYERLYPDAGLTDDYESTVTLDVGLYIKKRMRLQADVITDLIREQDAQYKFVTQVQVDF